MERYRSEIARLCISFYQPSAEHDLLLVNWWATLNETGDIAEIFHPQNRALSTFISIFSPPTLLFYSTDERGQINFAQWFSQCDMAESAAFVSIWASHTIRATRDLFHRELICHLAAFALKKHHFAVTRLKNVALFTKTGYTPVGTMPGFYSTEPGNLLHMTLLDFQQSRIYRLFIFGNKEFNNGPRH